jgi:DNA-directed RNA polymerase specialized sigma subunit
MHSNILKEDIVFFLDMMNSHHSPNFKRQYGIKSPYVSLLKGRSSTEYKRFITIYRSMNHIFMERERLILDRYYGVLEPTVSLKIIGKEVNLTAERVRQLIAKAENLLAKELAKMLKMN